MKKLLTLVVGGGVLLFSSCSKEFDDSFLTNRLDNLEKRVQTLEELCSKMNTNISSLQSLVDALSANDFITKVEPIRHGGDEIGYIIYFDKGDSITIYHGTDGKDGTDGADGVDGADGHTPIVGVRQAEDGVYYWTLDGEWLLDDKGNKVRAQGSDGKDGANGNDGADGANGNDGANGADGVDGKDGVTPKLRIEDDYWYISYDNGVTWEKLGKATGEDGTNGVDGTDGKNGESMFADIDTSNPDYVIFTLTDGTIIKIPTWYAFEALQRLCAEMNNNIENLKTIVSALEENDYIISVTPVTEKGKVIGYTICFAKNDPIVIYHGTDGKDGADGTDGTNGVGTAPVISVRQDTDGVYYWTLDGEWLLDDKGNKVRAQGSDGKDGANGNDGADGANGNDGANGADGVDGKDGVTPKLKIENDYWYVSYDNGLSWVEVGKATGADGANGEDGKDGENGDSFFKAVDTSNKDYVIITLADDTQIKIPTWAAFEALQTRVNEMNTTIKALSDLVNTINAGDYITKVEAYVENGVQVGYQIYFYKSAPIVIYNNINPIITVKKDEDSGLYYWAMNGEWLKDSEGNRLPAQLEDYVIPQIKAEDGFWMISTDGGNTWSQLCEVSEDALKVVDGITITQDDNYVYFTLAGGTVLSVHKYDGWLEYEKINFVDQKVKDICVTNWDTDGNGELTYEEAKAVTSLGSVFAGNTEISAFEELQYFTGLASINNSAFKNCSNLAKIVLPKNIKAIGDEAFNGCSKLQELSVPEGVVSIGENTFANCTALHKIVIPEGLTYIGRFAFSGCTALSNINLTDSILEIEECAFNGCSSIASIKLPSNLQTINQSLFRGCVNLVDVTLPEGLINIANGAFGGCKGMTTIELPDSISIISGSAFSDCTSLNSVKINSLESWCNIKFDAIDGNPLYHAKNLYVNGVHQKDIIIPDSVTRILPYTFAGSNITGVALSDNVTIIGTGAFNGCSELKSINIPDNITTIEDTAFSGCSSLQSVVLGSKVLSIGFDVFRACTNLKTVDLGESITTIGSSAFFGCTNLSSITLPATIKSISYSAFEGCVNLENINISSLEGWCNVDFGIGYWGERKANPFEASTIETLYVNGSPITNLTIPSTVSIIKLRAFCQYEKLTSVTISDGVSNIGDEAFGGCVNLSEVNIGNTVNTIGGKAFENCLNLQTLSIGNAVNAINNNAFSGCTSLRKIVIPDSVVTIGDHAFYGCSAVKDLTIGERVTTIGSSAFHSASSLERIIIPNSVTTIGPAAFASCIALKDLTVGNNVTSIGESSFENNSSLEAVILPETLNIIHSYAFRNCTSLANVYCKALTPPNGSANYNYILTNIAASAKIFVPSASVDAYKESATWSKYAEMIVGYDFSAME